MGRKKGPQKVTGHFTFGKDSLENKGRKVLQIATKGLSKAIASLKKAIKKPATTKIQFMKQLLNQTLLYKKEKHLGWAETFNEDENNSMNDFAHSITESYKKSERVFSEKMKQLSKSFGKREKIDEQFIKDVSSIADLYFVDTTEDWGKVVRAIQTSLAESTSLDYFNIAQMKALFQGDVSGFAKWAYNKYGEDLFNNIIKMYDGSLSQKEQQESIMRLVASWRVEKKELAAMEEISQEMPDIENWGF